MRERLFTVLFAGVLFSFSAQAQNESIVQKGDVGFTVGASQYFGDINPRGAIKDVHPAFGIFYRKQYTTYLGLRISAHYTQLSSTDANSKNLFLQERNLSFQTNLWELAVHGDFNFFKFIPGEAGYLFTPYITLGLGVFNFDPYTTLEGRKVYLRPLGTEGQNIGYRDVAGKKRKPYNTTSVCMPFGMGVKYNIGNNVNLSFQIGQRLTFTDYIDDVSTTYVGADNFVGSPDALALQDRSPEVASKAIGDPGRQRGWSKQKDQYMIAELGISFNIKSYRCPTNY